MKNFKYYLILLTIALSAMFLLNTGLMYVFFGINAINPVQREEATGPGLFGYNASRHVRDGTEAEPDTESHAAGDTGESAGEYPVTGTGPGIEASDSAAAESYMTTEEVKSLGGLSLQDKLAALTIISRISSSESDRIYGLAADGVTYAEMEEIKAILEKRLSEADMEVLYGILDKGRKLYAEGLSDQKEKGQQAFDDR